MASLISIFQQSLSKSAASTSNETKRIILKEVLQAYILNFIYNHSIYRSLNFYGGTCLHVVYGLNRLSEDLDFDNSKEIDLSGLETELEGYILNSMDYQNVTIKIQESNTGILRFILRFPILNELGLSSHPNESLHLKLEISTHNQIAIIQKTPVVVYGNSFVPAHFSLETMMAGKILACLERDFKVGKSTTLIKGRDFYDLLWFMEKKTQPLEKKLLKDGKESYSIHSAFSAINGKVKTIKTSQLAQDLNPLFENRAFIDAWVGSFHETFQHYLKYYLP